MSIKLVVIAVLGLIASAGAHASLIARVGGMVYDDVNNITWAADANLFATQAAGNSNLVSEIIAANGGVIHDIPNGYDTVTNSGIYVLSTSDFNVSNGQMTWWGAQAWANKLILGGVNGWSLPNIVDATNSVNLGFNMTSSPMGDLFYSQLGGVADTSINTTHNVNYNLFVNVQDYVYWSSSEYAPIPHNAWYLNTVNGYQGLYNKDLPLYAWAVHVGDVASVSLPSAVWLFLTGLLGCMGLKRRSHINN